MICKKNNLLKQYIAYVEIETSIVVTNRTELEKTIGKIVHWIIHLNSPVCTFWLVDDVGLLSRLQWFIDRSSIYLYQCSPPPQTVFTKYFTPLNYLGITDGGNFVRNLFSMPKLCLVHAHVAWNQQ